MQKVSYTVGLLSPKMVPYALTFRLQLHSCLLGCGVSPTEIFSDSRLTSPRTSTPLRPFSSLSNVVVQAPCAHICVFHVSVTLVVPQCFSAFEMVLTDLRACSTLLMVLKENIRN